MKRTYWVLLTLIFFLLCTPMGHARKKNLKIGVTLHPYYSWVINIAGDTVDVIPIIPAASDPHSYQPRPEDMKALESLDAIVVNGLGHDEFIKPMLKAAGCENLKLINPHQGLPLIPSFHETNAFEKEESGGMDKVAYNSHTYISITGSIQQIHSIARELGLLNPAKAKLYEQNAWAYVKRLRKMLGNALSRLNTANESLFRIATVHDGYAYLMQELGLEVVAVIQPRHGIEPTPRQLKDTINRIKEAGVNILFAEVDYDKKYVEIIFQETGCKIYKLSHVSRGAYSAELFEQKMQENLDSIVKAVTNAK